MTRGPLLFRLVARLLPARWRDSVTRDLLEEAARSGRPRWRRMAWLVRQGVAVAVWLAWRGIDDWRRRRIGWRHDLDGWRLDVRMAARAIARQPWSAAAIVLTLALGLSASTAAFAVFDHVLFRPVPGVDDPDELATVYFQPRNRQPSWFTAPREALDAFRATGAFVNLGASTETELPVVARPGADAEFVRAELVTDEYQDALRLQPRVGRLLNSAEIVGRQPVAVISERWWRRGFGGDQAAIGQSFTINRQPVTIVGVVAGYRGWGALRIGTVDVWMPLGAPVGGRTVSADTLFNLVGRLPPGATPALAEQRLRAAFAPFGASVRLSMSMGSVQRDDVGPVVYAGLQEAGGDQTRAAIGEMYPFALGASGLLLLLACANTANLLLARTMKRGRELALRSAIGAGRWRLARGQLVEAAAIAGLATGFALALARVFVAVVSGERLFAVAPVLDEVAIAWRTLVFAAGLGVVTIVLFGLVPALSASRTAQSRALAGSGRSTRATARLRGGLVAVQLALAFTLLASAGVLVRTLHGLRAIDFGLQPDGVVVFSASPMRLGYDAERQHAFVIDAVDRLRRLPGVESVAFASPSPFWRGYVPASLKTEPLESAPEHRVSRTVVTAEYFDTLRIPILAGRAFTAAEFARRASKESVGVVSQSLARALFGEATAVGRRIYLSQAAEGWRPDRTIEIVGVTGDTRTGANLREAGRLALYEPAGAGMGSASVFFVRSGAPAAATIATVRGGMRALEPNLPIVDIAPVRQEIERLIPEARVLAFLISGVALIAALLSVAGVHAISAHTVGERTREFGIRMALGASRAAVARAVLRGVAVPSAIGLAAGLACFAGASRLLEARVYGVSAMDPGTLVMMSLVLLAAAFGGASLPTRRAARVDPARSLRAD